MPDAPPPDDRRDTPDEADSGPSAAKKDDHAGGFTLDLSSGASAGQPETWRRKRKQASPILTKIVDLSAPKPSPEPPRPAAAKAPSAAATPPRGRKRDDERGRGKKPSGATLADLLDEETLARLRGED